MTKSKASFSAKPKKIKSKSKLAKTIGFGGGAAYGASDTPSPTEMLFGEENQSILGDIGVEIGAIKSAEKGIKSKPAKKFLNSILKKLAIKGGLAATGVGTPAAIGLLLGDVASTGKAVYDMSPEERQSIINVLPDYGKSLIETPEFFKPYAKATKKRMAKNKKQVFKKNKKDILKAMKRKKGGKIGRPKGVGCATKGYGKAMKRGK